MFLQVDADRYCANSDAGPGGEVPEVQSRECLDVVVPQSLIIGPPDSNVALLGEPNVVIQ